MKRIIYLTLTFVLLAVACRKEEFQQPPHGAAVPYIDTATHTLTALLGGSTYRLFNAAWQKSNVDTALTNKGSGIRFTVLAPDDAAMTAAGYTSAVIASASVEEMDSLVRYHVIPEYIDTAAVRTQLGNVRHNSILKDGRLIENLNGLGSNVTYPQPYIYRQYIAMGADGGLLINGKNTGPVSSMYAKNGVILHVNQVLQRPRESIIDFLRRDPRFTIFTALCDKTDSIWLEVGMGFMTRYYSLNYFGLQPDYYNNTTVVSDAFFAPTNEAFKNAGFNSVDDLMALNERSMPYFDWDISDVVNGFVTDSLLDYHAWGRLYAPASIGGSKGMPAKAVFYSNDLDNNVIGGYDLSTRFYNDVPAYRMPLEFGINAAGQRTVKVKGSSKAAAAIVEADVNTFQGPVHVMNNLILSDKVAF